MNERDIGGLAESARRVELARERLDIARLANKEAAKELASAEEAASDAEAHFMAFAWYTFGLPTPFDRFVSGGGLKQKGPRDRPATVKG